MYLDQIEKSCITFYTDVISSLCFGQAGPPDDKLVEKLLQTVFTASKGTEAGGFSPFVTLTDGSGSDEVPVIRSFLLQLLFRDRYYVPILNSCYVHVCSVFLIAQEMCVSILINSLMKQDVHVDQNPALFRV